MSLAAAYNVGRNNMFEILNDKSAEPKKDENKGDSPEKTKNLKKEPASNENVPANEGDHQTPEGFQEVNRSRPSENRVKTDSRAKNDLKEYRPEGRGRGAYQGGEGGERRGRGGYYGGDGGERRGRGGGYPAGEGGERRGRGGYQGDGERRGGYYGGDGGERRGGGYPAGEGGERRGRGGYQGDGERRGAYQGGEGGRGRFPRNEGRDNQEGDAARPRYQADGERRPRYANNNNFNNTEGAPIEGEAAPGGGAGRGGRGGRGGSRYYEGGRGGRYESGEGNSEGRGRGRQFRDRPNFPSDLETVETSEDNPSLSASELNIPADQPSKARDSRPPRQGDRARRDRPDRLVENKFSGTVKPAERQFERRSGTGRPLNDNKKRGGGNANWGKEGEYEADVEIVDPTMPGYVEPAATESTAPHTESNATDKSADPEATEAAEEEKKMTLSEWQKNILEPTQAKIPLPAARKAGEGYDQSADWSEAQPLSRETENTVSFAPEKTKKKVEKKVEKSPLASKNKEQKLQVEFKIPDNRGPRRDYRSHQSDHSSSQNEEAAKPEFDFPALGKAKA